MISLQKRYGLEAVVTLLDCEAERGIPSKNHAIIQNNLLVELTMNYRGTYQFLSEISLENPRAVPAIAYFHLCSMIRCTTKYG